MNTRDDIIDALEGRRGDMAPPAVFTQTGTTAQMESSGAWWPEACRDPSSMARLSLEFSRRYGFATAKVPFCLTVEAEAFGCGTSHSSRDRQPSAEPLPIGDGSSIPPIPDLPSPSEFLQKGSTYSILEAARKVRTADEDLFLVTGTVDPFMTAYHMVGVETFVMGTLMEPESAFAWIDAVTPCLAEYSKALSEVSDDVQIVVLSASEIVLPSVLDRTTIGPASRIISGIGCFSSVHSCGNTSDILPQLASMGETALSVESPQGPEEIVSAVGGKVRLIGGIPAVDTLLKGTPEEVISRARRYSDCGYDLITPECGIPPNTSSANLLALSGYRG